MIHKLECGHIVEALEAEGPGEMVECSWCGESRDVWVTAWFAARDDDGE